MTQDRTRSRGRCLIGDRRYELELGLLAWRPVDTLREQTDQGQEPGEGSLSNRALWRRTARDFRHGAGQAFFDEDEESSRRRFYVSKGIDCWEPRALSLLPATARIGSASANTTMKIVVVAGIFYALDGTTLRYSTDGTTFAGTVAMQGTAPLDISTDGRILWIAVGTTGSPSSRIFYVDPSVDINDAFNYGTSRDADKVAWVNGRLVFTEANALKEATGGGGTETTLWTHTDLTWAPVQLLGTPSGLYVGGNNGDQGHIYRLSIDQDGTWGAAVLAAGLEAGESFRAMEFYAGVMIVGTSLGVRVMAVNEDGSLVRSKYIEEPGDVTAVHVAGKYAYFAWNDYDGTSTGLGRLDLSEFTDTLIPAFASDLMVTGQGDVVSIATFNGKRIFAVAGLGFYREDTTLVAQGTYDSGWVTFGVSELKSFAQAEVRLAAAAGVGDTVVLDLLEESTTVTNVFTIREGSLGETGSIDDVDGEAVRVQLTLNRTTAAGPTVRRWTLRAIPLSFSAEEWFLPVLLLATVDAGGQDIPVDTLEEYRYLTGLRDSKARLQPMLGAHQLPRGYVSAVAADPSYVRRWSERNGQWFVEAIVVVQFTTIG